jgi:hypothetical protein
MGLRSLGSESKRTEIAAVFVPKHCHYHPRGSARRFSCDHRLRSANTLQVLIVCLEEKEDTMILQHAILLA